MVDQGRLGHRGSFLMGMAVPPRGRASRRVVGLSPRSRGVGRRTTHILVLEPFGVPAVRSGAALSGLTLAPRVRNVRRSIGPKASALVGGRVSVPDLASVELSALPGQTRPAFSRSASSLDGGPAVVRGGRCMLRTLSFLPLMGRLSPALYPPPYSITSSACACRLSGTVTPRAFAVLRLMTSSNLVDRATGRSDGLVPLRILST